MITFLMVLQLIVSVGLIAVVVMQQSKGEGLGSIGGGSKMFFDQATGPQLLLDKATTYLAVFFLVFSIVLHVWG